MHSNQIPQKTQRSHEENQERAYIAASRRSDRSLEARVQSAQMASKLHKQRTGKALQISEEIVAKGEMYEEEEERFPRSLWLSRDSTTRRSSEPITHPTSQVAGSAFMSADEKNWRENQINQAFAQAFPQAQKYLSQPWSQSRGPARHYSDSFLEPGFQPVASRQDTGLFLPISQPELIPDPLTQSPSSFALTSDSSSRSVSPESPIPPPMWSADYELNGMTFDPKMHRPDDREFGITRTGQADLIDVGLYGDRVDLVEDFILDPYLQESEWINDQEAMPTYATH